MIAAPQQSAADLASSFLDSVGQELHGSSEANPYGGHEAQGKKQHQSLLNPIHYCYFFFPLN